MNSCGLIVEYNPFHNGHVYHIQQAKKKSQADCIVAVMSGSFLQRGEPAIIDKFHRVKAALKTGIDIVLELPYVYAVESSDLFAKGAVLSLQALGVSSICFGSESGNIQEFIQGYHKLEKNKQKYQNELKIALKKGKSFPEASKEAYDSIGINQDGMDLTKPNNILGHAYVQTILKHQLPIQPLTIKRKNSEYHEKDIIGLITSATSIRKQLLESQIDILDIAHTMPPATITELKAYKEKATTLHDWEQYFPLLQYRIMTMSAAELREIHGVEEGIENRIKKTAKDAYSFHDWVSRIKTKRYTWTRIQRTFVHILTNTKKTEISNLISTNSVPYIRLLGMTRKGQEYLNSKKKQIEVPIYNKLSRHIPPMMEVEEERATNAYYSILPIKNRQKLLVQEFQGPILLA